MDAFSAHELDRSDAAFRKGRARVGPREDARKKPVGESDEQDKQFLSVETLRRQYNDYLTQKTEEIEEQKQARRYYHGAQLTAEQLRVLKDRRQPPQIWNRVARKINRRIGLIERLRSDPKATGRNPKSERGAEIATISIRDVLDSNEFKSTDWWCLLQSAIDGVSGVQLVLIDRKTKNRDLKVEWVIADEYFYDAESYRFDFKDSDYEGISKWFKLNRAIELFPEKEDELKAMLDSGSDLTSNPDREIRWSMTTAQKLRIVEHWYRHRGQWCWAFYTGTILLDQGVSPFVDENGESCSSFCMFSRAVDQDGDRYGDVRNIRDPQDALNAGKSKTLFLANTKTVQAEKGAVDDVEIGRREVARPDGWVETNPGKKFEVMQNKNDLETFIRFTEDAKSELDADAGENIANMTNITNISGRAIELLRQPGMAELGPFILSYRGWKLRLYRKIWNAVQRHWQAEKWLRISDGDTGLAQFIQVNGLGLDQFGRPAIVNALGQLDVNIMLDEGPDVAAMMYDTFDALSKYPPGTIPPQVLIELNPNIPRSDKNRIMQMLSPQQQPPDPMAEIGKKLTIEGLAARNAKTAAETARLHAQAEKETATALEKHVGARTEIHGTQIAAQEFERDSVTEALRIMQQFGQPQGMPPQAVPRPPAAPAPALPQGA